MSAGRCCLPLLGLVVLLMLAGGARASEVLRRVSVVEPATLDPGKTPGMHEIYIEEDLFEGLASFDASAHAVPGAAERWEISPDGLVWTFHLRPDGRWSNGDRLVADDFVYAMRRQVDPALAAPQATALDMIANAAAITAGTQKDLTKLGVVALDDNTVQFRLIRPFPMLAEFLAMSPGFPVHRASIERYGDQWTRPGHLVGNGAFVLADWVPQSQITLKRNPLFHGAAEIALDEVDWVVAEDEASALKRYRAGDLDIARVGSGDLDWVRKHLPHDLHVAPTFSVSYIAFNMHVEPFASNLKLRQALSLAIDRDAINYKVDPGGDISAYGYVPPGIAGYSAQSMFFKDLPSAERIALAQKLFRESGVGKDGPLKISVIYYTDRPIKKRLTAIAAMWKDVLGVEMMPVNREWQVYLAALRDRDYQVAISTDIGTIPDALDLVSSFRSTVGEMNGPGYSNPVFDQLIDAAQMASSPEIRAAYVQRAEKLLLDDQPIIPISFGVRRMLVNPRLIGWRDNLMTINLSRYINFAPAAASANQ